MREPFQWIVKRLISVATFVFTLGAPLGAQTVHGKLIDPKSGAPVESVSVTLVTDEKSPVGKVIITDGSGAFALPVVAPGIYRVQVAPSGQPAQVSPAIELLTGDDVAVALRLNADGVRLTPIKVTAKNKRAAGKLGGFAERASKRTFGRFITREDIEKRHPVSVSDMLATIPGLQVVPSPRGFGNEVRSITGCRPAVYLDGVRFPLMGESIDHIVDPMDVEGIEVYTNAAEMPVEYQGPGASCGAILLWTRGF